MLQFDLIYIQRRTIDENKVDVSPAYVPDCCLLIHVPYRFTFLSTFGNENELTEVSLLDCLLKGSLNGILDVVICRKPTCSNQYVEFGSTYYLVEEFSAL